MATQWRALFDSIGVTWQDRGRNCSRGHVNIACPFCLDDPSFHCTISEQRDLYYCYRDPAHKGHARFLLQRLVHSRLRAEALLETYGDADFVLPPPAPPIPYDRFAPADRNPRILDYLHGRQFRDPIATCRRFDLRFAAVGRYAARVLLPLIDQQGVTQAFVGRAIRADLEPTYKMANPELAANLVHGVLTGQRIILVEGPFDALKINASLYARLYDVSAIAMLGKTLTPARQNLLATRRPKEVLLCFDRDVRDWRATKMRLTAWLQCVVPNVRDLPLPVGYKDAGQMRETEIVDWLGATDALSVGRRV